MKLILASTSKLKSDILNKVKLSHIQIKSDFEEVSDNLEDVYQYVKDLSLGKAKSIENKVRNGIIIGIDTIVYADGKILEKPKDLEEAKEYIRLCASNTTSVITGIALINKETNEIVQDYQETKITLREINEEDIDYYIENEKDILYVSGFVIETIISNFIEKIEGSYYNILGVPVERIYEYLLKWNIHLKDLEK